MVVNCDLDYLVYRTCYACKGDFIQSTELLEGYLQSIYTAVDATSSNLILSGVTNFRTEVDPNYKSSRKDKPKPRYYKALREYAIDWLGASVTCDKEADDMLGILQTDETCAATIDKDLLQIPGYHYRLKKDWSKNELIYVSEDEAWFNFFKQVCTGDAVDCVSGLKGIGEVKATKALQGKTKGEMLDTVQEMYCKQFGDGWFEPFDRTCRLIWIQRKDAQNYFDLL